MATEDKNTQVAGDPTTAALAKAIEAIVGKAAHESAEATGDETIAVVREIPEVVRAQIDELLERHGLSNVPVEVARVGDRLEAVAEKISTILNESGEAQRAHFTKTLDRTVSEMKHELSQSVLSLTKSMSAANQRIAQLDSAFSDRLALLTQRLDLIERTVEERSAANGKIVAEHASRIDAGFVALGERLTPIGDRVAIVGKKMDGLELACNRLFSIEPRVAEMEEKLARGPSAVRVVENKLDAASAAVRALDEKVAAGPSAVRALEQKLESLERTQREIADAMRGRRREVAVMMTLFVLAFASALGTIFAFR